MTLDPSLNIEPEARARSIYASLLRDEGDDLATKGDIPGAVAKFEEAMTLDPSLNIEPEARATATAAVAMVEQAASLARNGKIREAGARLSGSPRRSHPNSIRPACFSAFVSCRRFRIWPMSPPLPAPS